MSIPDTTTVSERDMTTAEVAADLQCTEDHVRSLLRRGEIAAYRLGRSYRVTRADLQDFKRRRAA